MAYHGNPAFRDLLVSSSYRQFCQWCEPVTEEWHGQHNESDVDASCTGAALA
jgi:hypothetical protein